MHSAVTQLRHDKMPNNSYSFIADGPPWRFSSKATTGCPSSGPNQRRRVECPVVVPSLTVQVVDPGLLHLLAFFGSDYVKLSVARI